MSVTPDTLVTHFQDQLQRSPVAATSDFGSTFLLTSPPQTLLPDCEDALSRLVASSQISDYAHISDHFAGCHAYLVLRPSHQGGPGASDLPSGCEGHPPAP